MKRAIGELGSLLLGTFLLLAGSGLLNILLPVRVEEARYSTMLAAVMTTTYFLGLIGGSLGTHAFVVAVGHIRVFSAFAALAAAVALSFSFLPIPWWVVLRLPLGFCISGLFVVIESWLNANATNEYRGKILAAYLFAVYLGTGGGQLLLGVAPPAGDKLFMLSAMLFACALVPVALIRSVAPRSDSPELLGTRQLWKIAPLGVVGCLASGAVLGPFYGLAPIYLLQLQHPSLPHSLFMFLVVLGGLLLQWPVGWLSDRFDRRTVLVFVLLALSGICLLLGFARSLPLWGVLAGAMLFGALSFSIYPLSVAQANDSLRPEQLVAASGALLLFYSLGAMLSPLPVGWLMGRLGAWLLFPLLGGIALLLGLYTLYRMWKVKPLPSNEQSPFVALPRTTPVIAEMDPRTVESPEPISPYPQEESPETDPSVAENSEPSPSYHP